MRVVTTPTLFCIIFQVDDDNFRYFLFCGYHPPPPLTSKGQSLQIRFTVEIYRVQLDEGVGFNATYRHIDGKGR